MVIVIVPVLADEAYLTLTEKVVARAVLLDVAYAGRRGCYIVTGADGRARYVNLLDPAQERCDCGDHIWRNRICKHIAAVLIALGDYRMWCRLQDMLFALSQVDG